MVVLAEVVVEEEPLRAHEPVELDPFRQVVRLVTVDRADRQVVLRAEGAAIGPRRAVGHPEVGLRAGDVDQALGVEHVADVDARLAEPVLDVAGEVQVTAVLLGERSPEGPLVPQGLLEQVPCVEVHGRHVLGRRREVEQRADGEDGVAIGVRARELGRRGEQLRLLLRGRLHEGREALDGARACVEEALERETQRLGVAEVAQPPVVRRGREVVPAIPEQAPHDGLEAIRPGALLAPEPDHISKLAGDLEPEGALLRVEVRIRSGSRERVRAASPSDRRPSRHYASRTSCLL